MMILLTSMLFHFAVLSANDITGVWLNPGKTRSIRIYEQNGKYYGIMHWIGEPDPKLKRGQLVLKDLTYKDGSFKNGMAYTPAYGWVACDAKLANRQLYLTGHKFGIARTRVFLQGSN